MELNKSPLIQLISQIIINSESKMSPIFWHETGEAREERRSADLPTLIEALNRHLNPVFEYITKYLPGIDLSEAIMISVDHIALPTTDDHKEDELPTIAASQPAIVDGRKLIAELIMKNASDDDWKNLMEHLKGPFTSI
jgi:hypothetical protein